MSSITSKSKGCVLANNHVIDWGYAGLQETLAVLRQHGILSVGAGCDRGQAEGAALYGHSCHHFKGFHTATNWSFTAAAVFSTTTRASSAMHNTARAVS